MKRRNRRRMKRKKKGTASFKRWRRRLIGLSIVCGLVYFANFVYSNLYAIVMNYASRQTINIATLIIKEAIGQSELVSFNVEDVIHFEENDEGYVSSVYINTPELNRLLVSATHQVEEKLLLVENGDLSELGLDAIYGGPYEDGILLSVPLMAALNLSLFHEYGPRLPVSSKVIGNAVTDIVTDVKPYGINNALLEISLKVTVRMKVTLPFKSDETMVAVKSPIVIKMITGQTPQYYYMGSSSSISPLSPFTNESGKINDSPIKEPNLTPDPGIENGIENSLLQ